MARPHPRLSGTLFASKIAVACTRASLDDSCCAAGSANFRNTTENLCLATHQPLLDDATMRIFGFNLAQLGASLPSPQRINAQTK
jgi:hypothetical protein